MRLCPLPKTIAKVKIAPSASDLQLLESPKRSRRTAVMKNEWLGAVGGKAVAHREQQRAAGQ